MLGTQQNPPIRKDKQTMFRINVLTGSDGLQEADFINKLL